MSKPKGGPVLGYPGLGREELMDALDREEIVLHSLSLFDNEPKRRKSENEGKGKKNAA
jgi:hypothetical protein